MAVTETELNLDGNLDVKVDDPVKFDDAQKAQVNKLMQARLAREKEVFEREKVTLVQTVDQLKQQVEELTKKSQTEKSPADKKASKDELEELQGKIQQMADVHKQKVEEFERFKTQTSQLAEEKKKVEALVVSINKEVAISNACRECEFVDANLVLRVTKDFVIYDEATKKYQVLDDDGNVKLNSAMEPQGLKDFFKEYAANHPYLVNGAIKSGTGSAENKNGNLSSSKTVTHEQCFGKGSDSALAAKVMKDSPAKYHHLKKQAQEAGRIPA